MYCEMFSNGMSPGMVNILNVKNENLARVELLL